MLPKVIILFVGITVFFLLEILLVFENKKREILKQNYKKEKKIERWRNEKGRVL